MEVKYIQWCFQKMLKHNDIRFGLNNTFLYCVVTASMWKGDAMDMGD